jgi:integrase
MGLAGAHRDGVGRARLRARRCPVVLGPLPGGDLRGHGLRAPRRRGRRGLAAPGRQVVSAPRDATLLSVLAYARLRPQEALGLCWAHVRERTLLIERAVSLGVIGETKTRAHRTVRLLAPLRKDLLEWRLRSGRPRDVALVFPGPEGGPWGKTTYDNWRKRALDRAYKAIGLDGARPYDLRHSFASLLLHEGAPVTYVARQLGHNARLTLGTYGHVFDELDDAPRVSAENAIQAARRASCVSCVSSPDAADGQ